MAFSQVLAVANRNNVTLQSPSVAMPANLTSAQIRVDLATPNTFNDPVNESLALVVQFDYDDGTGFHDAGGGTVPGSSTNTWGKGSTNPFINVTVPQGPPDSPAYPIAVRGSVVQVGHFSFGLSIQVQ